MIKLQAVIPVIYASSIPHLHVGQEDPLEIERRNDSVAFYWMQKHTDLLRNSQVVSGEQADRRLQQWRALDQSSEFAREYSVMRRAGRHVRALLL